MAIKKVGPMSEITSGQWVCETPIMRDGICSAPRQVARRSGKRVYLLNRHGEDEGRFIAVSSIVALCDTKEEADAFYAVSQAQIVALDTVKKEHAARAEALFGTSLP